ncbi:type II toxin-antitoxin system RelE/ParE family toxin [Skermanella mucosa]|nr:type II toxin-antitoxin system RelE/ParE family toxin [Skermanella mucosa]
MNQGGASRDPRGAPFAFDPERKAVLLVVGDKSGGSGKRFYRKFIDKADHRFSAHLESLRAARKIGSDGPEH